MKKRHFLTALLSGMMTIGFMAGAFANDSQPTVEQVQEKLSQVQGAVFQVGTYNAANAAYFTGHTFVAPLNRDSVRLTNVTFVDGAHTYWHIHHGTCQILVGASGHGYYQIWGEDAHKLEPGMVVNIPEGIKHWHGAAPGQMFQHIATTPDVKYSTEWLEPVDEDFFNSLK